MKPYSTLGHVTLGSQLRMFSDMITLDATAIFDLFGLAIDPKCFPVLYVLASEKDSTVTSIASTIGHSHVSVSKLIATMEAQNLTISRKCHTDSRRTLVNLSKSGTTLVPKLLQQCEQVDRALVQLAQETGIDFGQALAVTRQSLKYFPLSERIKALDDESDVRIIDFTPKYADEFKRLNVEWITRFWELEEADLRALDNPTQYIIDKGGAILMALHKGTPVGSVALIPHDSLTLELAKMAVSPAVQGTGVGLTLGQSALERARLMGAARVYLETNTKLTPAISLYRKLGFSDMDDEEVPSPYERCNVRMELFVEGSGAMR